MIDDQNDLADNDYQDLKGAQKSCRHNFCSEAKNQFLFKMELFCDQTVWFFQLFSTVLKRFWPGHAKNVFVSVLAHLEPELELFEVDDVGDDGDDDL